MMESLAKRMWRQISGMKSAIVVREGQGTKEGSVPLPVSDLCDVFMNDSKSK